MNSVILFGISIGLYLGLSLPAFGQDQEKKLYENSDNGISRREMINNNTSALNNVMKEIKSLKTEVNKLKAQVKKLQNTKMQGNDNK